MAFGKKLCQSKELPNPNNYCGGFAMCAVLNDIAKSDGIKPMDIYKAIQEFQAEVSIPLLTLIEAKKEMGGGTAICLPSSLVLFAQKEGLDVKLRYSKQIGFDEKIITAEIQRCPGRTEGFENAEAVKHCFLDTDVKYYLVLVSNYNHWIAVKRKPESKGFSVYDPGTGENMKFGTVAELTSYLSETYSRVGDLIITIKL